VVDVNDQVAGGQALEHVPRHYPPQGLGPADADRAEELSIGDQDEPVWATGEAAVQAPPDQRSGTGRRCLGQMIDHRRGQALLGQQVGQARRLVGGQDDPLPLRGPGRDGVAQALRAGRGQGGLPPAEQVAQGRSATGRLGRFRFPGQLESPAAQQP
jgi:hypothetical protein